MIAVLAGATAAGKSGAALRFARDQRAKGRTVEIINADAMQVYVGMDKGTAKASSAERADVPHHLLDVVTPDTAFSVADYVTRAEACLTDVLERGNIPLLVGGSGFYVRALRQGLPTVPAADMTVQAPLWAVFEREGIEVLERRLQAISPEDASRTQKNPRRVIRALEIIERTGNAPKDFPMTHPKFSYALLAILPPLDVLQTRIAERVDTMFAAGLVNEVRGLLEHYPDQPTALQAIGYKEVGQYLRDLHDLRGDLHDLRDLHGDLRGELSESACREQVRRATLQYAKRQRTWFRKEVRQLAGTEDVKTVTVSAGSAEPRAVISETLADTVDVQRWLEHWATPSSP
jgi:tRNA dimethylallyltransferase